MASSISASAPSREEVVPSRKRVKLPPWLEVAKPRLIPLLLATTLGGMALTEGWPLSSPRLVCTLGGGALASAAAAAAAATGELAPISLSSLPHSIPSNSNSIYFVVLVIDSSQTDTYLVNS